VDFASTGFGSSDLPARSESLYRLSYPGPLRTFTKNVKATQQRQSVSAHHTNLAMKGDTVIRFSGGGKIRDILPYFGRT